ncbi:ATP-binding protein [Geomonas sp. RF6]|uniref:sensor histidine kinase n=1 Tax=Geomonas sp. RF6 TaxID=2897342 RepID=UPI001E4FDFA2|nr:ATP-binding protein [Geomonas sp. RF6]UFS69974.1 ATP-binding protein [Geomonas sp. RF6]
MNFSRAGRVALRRERVDLAAMAKEAARELTGASPEREVIFEIPDGVFADGDPDLLRLVLDNLLGNAWKFTEGLRGAVIEFGTVAIDGGFAYFVRDNGPGFEAARAEKIFAPFQRLPGTQKGGFGIGLATVQRIIQRHGGHTWAEGTPGKGAIFYFTVR